MDKQKIAEVVDEIDTQIRKSGWKRDAVKFETLLINPIKEEEQYSEEAFEKEYIFLRNQWEVPLEYSISATSATGKLLRKVIRKISKIILYHYVVKQNAINYSNMQSIYQIRLFISQSQKENLELREKCNILENRVAELEKIVKNSELSEGS